MKVLRLMLVVALAAFFAVGCAKKPVETAIEEPVPVQVEAPVVTEMPSEPVTGFQETEVTEAPAVEAPADAVEMPGLERVFFDFDQYTLGAEARATLAANAEYLKANSMVRVVVEGHCDERGSDEYNMALGERRARATKDYLVSLGVEADRLSIISYGEEVPLEAGSTEEAWAKNRRAEFKEIR